MREVETLAAMGMTMDEMAAFWDVARSTVFRWAKLNKDFSDHIKHGRERAELNVEKSLYKRAVGFEYTEKEYTVVAGVTTLTKKKVKTVAPDVGAIAFFLKNKRPDKWRDRKDLEVSGPERKPLALIMTTEPSNGGDPADGGNGSEPSETTE